jgi:hypothetical protein
MSSSTPSDEHYNLDASRTAACRNRLSLLTVDEQHTYRKWKRAAFVVYGTVTVIIVLGWIAIGPTGSSPPNGIHSTLAASTARR